MVIKTDVDFFFKKSDLKKFFKDKNVWPWQSTHFILQKECYSCGARKENNVNHFVLPMKLNDIKMLIQSSFFWCDVCDYAIYDHYPEDECYCNSH